MMVVAGDMQNVFEEVIAYTSLAQEDFSSSDIYSPSFGLIWDIV